MRQFVPTMEWREVADDEVLPPGCDIRMSVGGGRVLARMRRVPPTPQEVCGQASVWVGVVAIVAALAVVAAAFGIVWVALWLWS